jgi:hypothetical protein
MGEPGEQAGGPGRWEGGTQTNLNAATIAFMTVH